MEPTTTRLVKDLLPGNLIKLNKSHAGWLRITAMRPNLPEPDAGKILLVLDLCIQQVLSPDLEVIISKTAMNIGAPMKDVRHADLKRVGDSQHTSECPCCGDGVLLMKRSPSSGKLQNSDFCTLCGQAFWYTDLPAEGRSSGEAGSGASGLRPNPNAGDMDVMKN